MALRIPVLFRASAFHNRLGCRSGKRSLLRGVLESGLCPHMGFVIRSSFGDHRNVRTHPVLLPAQDGYPGAPTLFENHLHQACHILLFLANCEFVRVKRVMMILTTLHRNSSRSFPLPVGLSSRRTISHTLISKSVSQLCFFVSK